MFDDLRRNFLLNPESGLRIKAFRNALTDGKTDAELPKLASYLLAIAEEDSFKGLDHRKWKHYGEGSKKRRKD